MSKIDYNPFDPANLRISKDLLASLSNGDKQFNRTEVRRGNKRQGFKFCQFPISVMDAIIAQRADWTAFAVLMILYELWFIHPNHYNPIDLTSHSMRRFGLSRWQKWRALQVLEGSGQVSIERRGKGKNPRVTLNWLPTVKPVR